MKQSRGKKECTGTVAARNQSQQEQAIQNFKDAEPILNELRAAGYEVKAFSELGSDGKPYKGAMPVLLKWLLTVTNLDVKEAIIRALSVPWASPAVARVIVSEFEKTDDHFLRWAIGNAMSVMATEEVEEEVIRIATDLKNGKAREMFAVSLGRLRTPQAANTVLVLLNDEVVNGHAVMAAGKLGLTQALPQLRNLAKHSKPWIRAEAEKAIRGIESKQLKQGRFKKPS